MDESSEAGAKLWGIKEVAAQTGLAASTIRYYDQQFSEYLGVQRGSGRRRLFDQEALGRLLTVQRLLKEEGLSLRQARQVLSGDSGGAVSTEGLAACQAETARLRADLESLKQQVSELKDIQRRTLALIDGLTGSG